MHQSCGAQAVVVASASSSQFNSKKLEHNLSYHYGTGYDVLLNSDHALLSKLIRTSHPATLKMITTVYPDYDLELDFLPLLEEYQQCVTKSSSLYYPPAPGLGAAAEENFHLVCYHPLSSTRC